MAKMNNKNKMKQNCKFNNVHRPLEQTGGGIWWSDI